MSLQGLPSLCALSVCQAILIAWSLPASAASTPKGRAAAEPLRMDIEWLSESQRPAVRQASGTKAMSADNNDEPTARWLVDRADRRLSITLQRWCLQADWQLVWEAERDFPIEVHAELHGTFSAVLRELMQSLSETDYPLQVVMNDKNRVLRVRHRSGVAP